MLYQLIDARSGRAVYESKDDSEVYRQALLRYGKNNSLAYDIVEIQQDNAPIYDRVLRNAGSGRSAGRLYQTGIYRN